MSEIPSPAHGDADQSLDTRRRRALWRAEHRGTKEMDIMLGRFAAAQLPLMVDPALARFERLLTEPDPDLHAWMLEPALATDADFRDLIEHLRRFHRLEPTV